MKIVYILHAFPGLYHTFSINEVSNLILHGHDVRIIAIKRSARKMSNENALKLKDRVTYLEEYLPDADNALKQFIFKHAGKFYKISKKLYVLLGRMLFSKGNWHTDYHGIKGSLGWVGFSLDKLADELEHEKCSLVFAAFGNDPATIALYLYKNKKIPFVFEAHAYDLFVDFDYAKEKINLASRIFTISNYNKNYLINKHNCDESKVTIVRVPINKEYCDNVKTRTKKKNQVISVCRLHPIKGLEDAIDAVNEVVKSIPDLQYLIVGDGSLRRELEKKVRKYSLERNVTFLGSMGNETALQRIAESQVVLLPSVIAENGDRDGIPTALIEAMYFKVPVISTNVSGIPELIEDGVSGFLVQPHDVKSLSRKLIQLLNNEALQSKLSENGFKKVSSEFSAKVNLERLLNGIDNISI